MRFASASFWEFPALNKEFKTSEFFKASAFCQNQKLSIFSLR